jgi:hypothetical protein
MHTHPSGKRLGVAALGGNDEHVLALTRRWFRQRKHG